MPTKVHIVKAMVFPVVLYACESWTIKKAEGQRTDAFELWCWRRLLGVPWTARRSNLSILKEISPEYSLEGLVLKMKLQYFGYLIWRTDSWKRPWCWERLKAGGEGDNRGWDGWMESPIQWTWVWARSRKSEGQESLVCCSPWGCKESDTTERLNWMFIFSCYVKFLIYPFNGCLVIYHMVYWNTHRHFLFVEHTYVYIQNTTFLSFPISCSLLKLMSIESVIPFNHLIRCHALLSCPQSFPASGYFPMSQLFSSGGQSIGASASASVFPMNIQG